MRLAGRRLRIGLVCAAVAGVAIAVCTPGLADKPATQVGARVDVKDNYFDPRSVQISAGEAVKWTWSGANRHNIVFTKTPAGAAHKNAKARRSGSVTRAFNVAGNYRYVCKLYDGMQGTIKVAPRARS